MNDPRFSEAQKLRDNGQIDAAIILYKQIREEPLNKDTLLAAECLHMIGVAYYQDREYANAKECLTQSLHEFETLKRPDYQGFVHRDLGMVERGLGNYSEALRLTNQSIDELARSGNLGHQGISLVKLGNIYLDLKDTGKALDSMKAGIKLLLKSDEKFFLSTAYLDYAKIFVTIGDFSSARTMAENAFDVLNSFSNETEFTNRRHDIKELLDGIQKN